MTYRLLDLFSGIGGFSLGLERTGGFKTFSFCEIDPFCKKVLKKHWPEVPCYDDVRSLTAERLKADGIAIDAICGGFPCQDVSLAGRRAGMGDTRSGLWKEYGRIIGELRPKVIIVENTPGLLSLGMGVVLGDLAQLGYDAEWHCIPAWAVGADHIRNRVCIVAYSHDWLRELERRPCKSSKEMEENASDTLRAGLQGRGYAGKNGENAGAIRPRLGFAECASPAFSREYRKHQPVLGRGVHGIPDRLDRIGALGNVIVPQVAEVVGNAILQAA